MVKLTEKSKRLPCAKRYKIEKRIRAHRKKTLKANPDMNTKKGRRKAKKTYKIPNTFPGKEELLDEASRQKELTAQQKTKKKDERRKLKLDPTLKEKRSDFVNDSVSLEDMVKKANQQQAKFDQFVQANPFNQFGSVKGNEKDKETSLKTFYKEFRKVTEAADVIIEVLDARDPIGTRCPQVEEMISSSGANKKIILLLNKIDLVPKDNVQKWLKYLRDQYPTVAFKASTQSQSDRLSQSAVPVAEANADLLMSSKCLGADILMKLLANYTRSSNSTTNDKGSSTSLKTSITVGIIGLPNVGKSSVINSLKRSAACTIGSTPGLTRCMKEVKLDKHIKLLDCPGIVMSKEEDPASLVLKNCIKIENIDDPIGPIDLLLTRCDKEELLVRYKIGAFEDSAEFLTLIAKRHGKIKKGGVPDLKKASHLILNDWTSGKLTYFTQPPEVVKPSETKIFSKLSEAFDFDGVLEESESKMFNSIDDTKIRVNGIQVKSGESTTTNFAQLEKEEESDEDEDSEEFETESEQEEKEIEEPVTPVAKNGKNNHKKVVVEEKGKKRNAENNKQTADRNVLKRKSCEIEEDADIYAEENIPRTKKTLKQEKKTALKKGRRNDKMFNNLGDMLNNVKLAKK